MASIKLDVPGNVTIPAVQAAVQRLVPPGTVITPKKKEVRIKGDAGKLRVRLKPSGKGTRLTVAQDYPGWIFLFIFAGLLLGLVIIFIIMAVIDSKQKGFREHVARGLPAALGTAAPPRAPLLPVRPLVAPPAR